MNMSKQGIYDQLTSEAGEQFTPEEAQYAVDNLKANYNENALKKAKVIKNKWQCHQKESENSSLLLLVNNLLPKKLLMLSSI